MQQLKFGLNVLAYFASPKSWKRLHQRNAIAEADARAHCVSNRHKYSQLVH
jgi:hypothetical protein